MSETDVRSTRALPWLVALSGACGLVYEIVWIRALGRVFGSTVGAVSTVVAAFMAGLALGSITLGRRADRSSDPVALYARLEFGIAIAAALVSLLLLRGGALLLPLSRLAAHAGPLEPAVRFAVFFALLLGPATLMGGTQPVLARVLARAQVEGRVVGWLYATNTAGAVLGALLPDAVLIPALGLTATVLLAAAGNATVGLSVRRLPIAAEPARATPGASPLPVTPLVLFGVSGFCAMGYEIVWSRVIEQLLGGRILAFALLLAVNLACVAIGARVASARADRSPDKLAAASVLMALGAVTAYAPVAGILVWRGRVLAWLPVDHAFTRPPISHTWWSALAHALYLEALPCLFMGAALPYLAAHAVPSGDAGRASGRLWAVNTLLGVPGAALTGFVLLPALGAQRALLALSALALVTALSVAARSPAGRRGALACAIAGLGFALGTAPDRLARLAVRETSARVLRLHDGPTTTVAVLEHTRFGLPAWRELSMPGVSMSDTRVEARHYMGVMAHLPMLLASGNDDALLICFGVGNTARSLLAHPGLRRLDVVDIAREVLDASPVFASMVGEDPLRDPRTHVFVDDGRHHLAVSGRRYDVITSEPPPPGHAGVVNLYSREYYALARQSLRPGGVLTQWLPYFELSGDETLAVIAAVAAEFRWVSLFYGYEQHLVIVGSDRAPTIDLASWERRTQDPSVRRDLTRIAVEDFADLAGSFVLGDHDVRALVAGHDAVTDDLPSIQYPHHAVREPGETPRGMLGDPAAVFPSLLGAGGDPLLLARVRRAVDVQRAVLPSILERWITPPELRELVLGTRLRAALARAPAHPGAMLLLDVGDETVALARRALQRDPTRLDARSTLASRAFYEGDWAAALERYHDLEPEARRSPAPRYWTQRAGCERALGRFDEATRSLGNAIRASHSAAFRARATTLLAHLRDPVDATRGPLSP